MTDVKKALSQQPAFWLPASLTLLLFVLSLVPAFRTSAELSRSLWGACAALLLFQAWLLTNSIRQGRRLEFKVALFPSHYVQASVQICVYIYWAWHWEQMRHQAWLILAQIVFAYAFDMLLVWSRRKTWFLGFGQFPIILSTNFFLCFRDDWFYLQFAMIAVGSLGKELFKWQRDGQARHIFNPSGFALSVFSIALILTDRTELTWGLEIATTLLDAPHMYVAIFLAGLVVQYFFSVTIVTVSAVATLVGLNLLYSSLTGVYFFVDASIPIAVFLGLHLLVTDPSTSPRSRVGSAIFGGLYGASVMAFWELLAYVDAPLFYDKLLAVPLLNLSVRMLDRVGRSRRVDSLKVPLLGGATRSQRVNLVFMAVWIGLFGWMLASNFVGSTHEGARFTFWQAACEEGRRNACDNLLVILESQCAAGSGEECNLMGVLFNQGEITPLDPLQGISYFDQACTSGFYRGCVNVAIQALLDRNVSITSAGVANAIAQLPEGCDGGDGVSCYLLAYAHAHGSGVPRDEARAIELYSRGCDLGERAACLELEKVLRARGR